MTPQWLITSGYLWHDQGLPIAVGTSSQKRLTSTRRGWPCNRDEASKKSMITWDHLLNGKSKHVGNSKSGYDGYICMNMYMEKNMYLKFNDFLHTSITLQKSTSINEGKPWKNPARPQDRWDSQHHPMNADASDS